MSDINQNLDSSPSINDLPELKASITKRFLNRLIDSLSIFIASIFISILLPARILESPDANFVVPLFTAISVFFTYFLGELIFGKSIGKVVTGTTVKTKHYKRATWQTLVRILQMIPYVAIIDATVSAFTLPYSGQTLHDMASGTIVVDDKEFAKYTEQQLDSKAPETSNHNNSLSKVLTVIIIGFIALGIFAGGLSAYRELNTSTGQVAGVSDGSEEDSEDQLDKINELEQEIANLKEHVDAQEEDSLKGDAEPDIISGEDSYSQEEITYETYINQYFPEFKLSYPNYMNFETQTRPSQFPQLLEREITLRHKDDIASLYIIMSPLDTVQCSSPDDLYFEKSAGELSRYSDAYSDYYHYLADSDCQELNVVQSNINYNDIKDYFVNDKPVIYYRIDIKADASGTEGGEILDLIIKDSNLVSEVDKYTFFAQSFEASLSGGLDNDYGDLSYPISEPGWLCNDYRIYTDEWKKCMGYADEPVQWIGSGTRCRDGWVSSSTGRGTCSWHGGIAD